MEQIPDRLVLDWRRKPETRERVRVFVTKVLDDLPDVDLPGRCGTHHRGR